MKLKVSVDNALRFTKLSVYLAYTWPPSINATKWEIVKNDIAILLSSLSILIFLIAVLARPIVRERDSVILTESIIYTIAGCNYIIKTHVYKVCRKRIQILTYEMEVFLKKSRTDEKEILQCYLDRCWLFHVLVTVTLLLTAGGAVCTPLITDQLLPIMAFYPFTVDQNVAIYYVIYIHQSISCFQLGVGLVLIDCQMAVIMWYASARLEILAGAFKNISSLREFRSMVQKHQQLLTYAIEISDTMSYIALVTMVSSGLGIILCCIQIVSKNQPLSARMNYAPAILMYMTNLFISAWPAENLLHVCDLMASTAYDASWMDMSPKWRKNYLFILERTHRPVKVSVAGFIPTLSFNFYGSFLSAAFSYFTTLRAAMSMNSEM